MQLRQQVIRAIFQRNFAGYFSGVLGYLFIVVFVVLGGALAFNARFFTGNEPTLDQLTEWYPLLLLFFVPAVTMSVWADERKSGTDELLFTLPATELEILIGKYLSVVAVYSVALVFSMAHVFVLMFLGNPDWGLIATTYFGYWLAGAAMLSAGMLASMLTANMTVAFVLGIVICALPVFIGQIGATIGLGDLLDRFSLREQFRDFGMGVIPLTALLYFAGFTVVMLYLNHTLMTRRHWHTRSEPAIGVQYAVRAISVAVVLSCVTTWAGYSVLRVDATGERLFSLSAATHDILDQLDTERPIEIQAFISPDVPREYVETRKRLVGLLRQFDELGGKSLDVRYVDVQPFSQQAEEAEHFGIEPVQVMTEVDGRRSETDVYLGAVIISSYDKVVVPFFGKGLPIEYELTRSIQTVANEKRHTVGVLRTDANLMGGSRDWQIVQELKKQYHVQEVSPSSAIDTTAFDVLLAVMPSSLTSEEMDHLVDYAKSGSPLLVFDDPFPLSLGSNGFGVTGAPRQPKRSPHSGFMGQGGPPPEQKADGGRATRLLDALGIDWQYDACVFDVNNPHPEFAMLPAEYVFVTRGGSDTESFNPDDETTKGLQEVIALYPGRVQRRGGEFDFRPLLNTSKQSGVLQWEEFVDEGGFNFFSMQGTANPRRNPFRVIDSAVHTLAARVTRESDDHNVNAIFVADVDMISDFFFEERNLGNLSTQFDNVTFVLNAVDSLVGDDSFIELRSRRPAHRTLVRVEQQKRQFLEAANQAEREADQQADEELELRRQQLGKRVKEIQENNDLDPIAKAQMLEQAQQAEQKRLSLAEAQIEQQKNDEIRKIRASTNRQIKSLESTIRFWSVCLPAIPAFALGAFVFVQRKRDEQTSVIDSRRRKHAA
ncbi:Gldg family protein [Rhodopirellula sp. JC639]|uniref:Gldg family protein n=1 Tax=Stieleria mannarensis TaxID=2755585 RepID=UPI0015FF6F59|nr:Gldg family protein [Rhodopirellula sp. JC639]